MMKALFSGLVMAGAVIGALLGSAAAKDLTPALLQCRDLTDDAARLDCFDRLVAGLGGEKTAAAEEQDQNTETSPPTAPVVAAQNTFGSEDLPSTHEKVRKEKEEKPKSMTATVVDIARNGRDKYVVILENGQVWRQLNADTGDLRIPSSGAEGLSVKIKRKMFGAHILSLEGDNRSIRVERIK